MTQRERARYYPSGFTFGFQSIALIGTLRTYRAKGNHMRNLVQPRPSLHCALCRGELQLKRIDPDGPSLEWDCEIFVCIKCGHEHSYRVSHDRYAAQSRRDKPSAKVG